MIVSASIADAIDNCWTPPRRPAAMSVIVPVGPYAGRTLGTVARTDPDHLSTLAAHAHAAELRAAARAVRAAVMIGGIR